jgi:hypothetical protein
MKYLKSGSKNYIANLTYQNHLDTHHCPLFQHKSVNNFNELIFERYTKNNLLTILGVIRSAA